MAEIGKVVKFAFNQAEEEEEKVHPSDQLLKQTISAMEAEMESSQGSQSEEIDMLKAQLAKQKFDRTPEGKLSAKQKKDDERASKEESARVNAIYEEHKLIARRLAVLDRLIDEGMKKFGRDITDAEIAKRIRWPGVPESEYVKFPHH